LEQRIRIPFRGMDEHLEVAAHRSDHPTDIGESLMNFVTGGAYAASAFCIRGLQLYIEVWPIRNAAGTGTEYVVEASFKTTSQTTASTKHDELITYLQGKGWFLAQDSLKTQLIMDRY
jgi:hypothetical protein